MAPVSPSLILAYTASRATPQVAVAFFGLFCLFVSGVFGFVCGLVGFALFVLCPSAT